eukprot:TRINITY_DN7047_c0_g1_i5.p1 TRINITY_DN7047_c0_g1~~TRINITY_DN7047_c0_g1_i5.p1  ORF type:complete len:664 (+),score=129.39 TRINITY_DN7047_c0_g1_i5:245-1993(+)
MKGAVAEAYLRINSEEDVERLFGQIQNMEPTKQFKIWDVTIRSRINNRKLNGALELLKEIETRGLRVSDHVWMALVRYYKQHHLEVSPTQIFDLLSNTPTPPGVVPWLNLRLAFASQGKEDEVNSAHEKMKKLGYVMRNREYIPLLRHKGRIGRVEEMINLFNEMRLLTAADVFAWATVINVLGAAKRYETADMLRKCEDSIQPDAHLYDCMIRAAGNIKKPMEALRLFRSMQKHTNPVPSTAWYTIIDALGKANRTTEMQEICQEMKLQGVPEDEVLIMNLKWIKENTNSIADIWKIIERGNVSEKLWSAMIRNLGNRNQPEEALKVFRKMQSEREASLKQWGMIMDALGKNGEVTEMTFLFEESQRFGISPNDVIWKILISNLGAAKRADVQKTIKLLLNDPVAKDPYLWNSFIVALGNIGNAKKAVAAFRKMQTREPHKITRVTWNSVLNAVGHCKEIDLMFAILNEMKEAGHKNEQFNPDVVTWATVMARLGRTEEVMKMFYELKSEPFNIHLFSNPTLWNIAINALGGNKNDDMIHIYEQMKLECVPDVVTHTTLMMSYAKMANQVEMERWAKVQSN